jgi:hypothetical protein
MLSSKQEARLKSLAESPEPVDWVVQGWLDGLALDDLDEKKPDTD